MIIAFSWGVIIVIIATFLLKRSSCFMIIAIFCISDSRDYHDVRCYCNNCYCISITNPSGELINFFAAQFEGYTIHVETMKNDGN
jgi:hypothetical protein